MGAIERHRFIKMDKDKESRLLTLNEYRDALNCRVGFVEEGKDGAIQNVLGNTLIYDETQAGFNRVIGTFEDEASKRVVYFLYNSNDNHAIYTVETTSVESIFNVTKVITGSFLAFNPLAPIANVGVIGDLCYWTDGINPQRVINLKRDYTGAGAKDILLHKIPPDQRPSIDVRFNDSNRTENYIADDNYQFAYRYIYQDNEASVFSPLSVISGGQFDPPIAGSIQQKIPITISFDTELSDAVKRIQLAYVKNNSGLYQIFDAIEVDGSSSYTYDFYDDTITETVPETDSSKVVEPIPFLSKALCTQDNRIFLNSDLEGYDPPNPSDIILTVTETAAQTNIFTPAYKEGGLYNFGVVYYDDRMRPTGVQKRTEFATGFQLATTSTVGTLQFSNANERPTINIRIDGTPPDFASYYQFVRTEELSRTIYMQVPVNVLQYLYEEGASAPAFGQSFVTDGKVFVTPFAWGTVDYNRIYLQLPKGTPFVPDTDTFVRIKNDLGVTTRDEQVIDVQGDFVVMAGDFNLNFSASTPVTWYVEFYKKDSTRDNLYFECSDVLPILNPGTSTRRYAEDGSGNATFLDVALREGDTYQVDYVNQRFFVFRTFLTDTGYTNLDYVTSCQVANLESPTGIATKKVQTEIVNPSEDVSNQDQEKTIYVMDYSKIGNSIGRPFVIIENERQTKNNLTVRYSNTFIPNSQINGLSNFESLNQEQLPIQYSPLVALVTVKNNIISVHERHSVTIYTSEGFIKDAGGADNALIRTDNVIGQTRELTGFGRLGTLHPESIVQHEGNVYWFDAIHGCAVEYTNAGAFPVSEMGLSNFFRTKSRDYLDGEVSFIWGGYDPRYDEYVMTFSDRGANKPAETIAYNTKVKAWTSRYSFLGEHYAKSGDFFYSFKDGSVWVHNDRDADRNNFYGTQYERRLTFYVNQNPNLTKVFTNIHLNAESIANGTAGFNVVEVATEQGQTSVVPIEEFVFKEGVYRTFIFRDNSNDGDIKAGNPMRSQVLEVTLVNNRKDDSPLYDAAVIYHQSHYSK